MIPLTPVRKFYRGKSRKFAFLTPIELLAQLLSKSRATALIPIAVGCFYDIVVVNDYSNSAIITGTTNELSGGPKDLAGKTAPIHDFAEFVQAVDPDIGSETIRAIISVYKKLALVNDDKNRSDLTP